MPIKCRSKNNHVQHMLNRRAHTQAPMAGQPLALRQASPPATAIMMYNTDHTGAKTQLGGVQAGFARSAYQVPGLNKAPVEAAAATSPRQMIIGMSADAFDFITDTFQDYARDQNKRREPVRHRGARIVEGTSMMFCRLLPRRLRRQHHRVYHMDDAV